MKDFVKWLGVNEKVAKVVVWLFIIMVMLIIFNTAMESLGFPYYAITYDNLVKINSGELVDYIAAYIITILNFYVMALLVFSIKDAKEILKYAIVFVLLDAVFAYVIPNIVMQIFMILYMIGFCYLYSKRKKKYIVYGLLTSIITAIIQYVWYISKVQFIDYSKLTDVTKTILSLDYFIIMAIIILVKEVYIKKRGEKDARKTNMLSMDRRIQKRKQIRKENRKKSS